jgi:hypothetical protein
MTCLRVAERPQVATTNVQLLTAAPAGPLPRRCHFNLPSVEAEDEARGKMPPIKVKFEIPYFTVSGVQVRQQLSTCTA